METKKTKALKKEINLLGGISLLSGIMVGSGIFFIGSFVLIRTEFSIGLALLVWLIGGIITLFSALVYAELGASLPFTGGYYVYLKEAYGKPVAFMSGFTNFILTSSGSIAALALAFSLILSNILFTLNGVWLSDMVQKLIAASLIIGLSVVNFYGVKLGTLLLKIFLWIKAIPIFLVLFLGIVLGTQTVDLSLSLGDANIFSVLAMVGFAVVATFWAYEGWTNLNNVTEEMKDPGKNLPKALIITVLSVTALYVLYNFSLHRVLSIQDMQAMIASENIYLGIGAASAILGSIGMYIVMFTMLISVFGAINGCVMAFPRVYFAMGKDGTFFKSFGRLHPKTKTPHIAIIASGLVAIALLAFNLSELVTLVAFGGLFFNTLIFASVFIFRKRYPDLNRPYKVWGYPVIPVFNMLVMIAILVSTFIESIRSSLIGALIILVSLPIYFIIQRFQTE